MIDTPAFSHLLRAPAEHRLAMVRVCAEATAKATAARYAQLRAGPPLARRSARDSMSVGQRIVASYIKTRGGR